MPRSSPVSSSLRTWEAGSAAPGVVGEGGLGAREAEEELVQGLAPGAGGPRGLLLAVLPRLFPGGGLRPGRGPLPGDAVGGGRHLSLLDGGRDDEVLEGVGVAQEELGLAALPLVERG